MLTDEQKKRKIEANIRKLDYLEGTGVLSTNKKKLVDEFFVFIGTGGSGTKALIKLKKTMEHQVDFECFSQRTMFLCIDSDWGEIEKYQNNGIFQSSEVIKFPFEGAHGNINPDKIMPQTKAWVHKDLWVATGGAGADVTPPPEFNGTGAGAKRQCGRVLFTQPAAQAELYNGLSKITDKLAKLGSTPKIKVFFLTGIAGGTGSGTIVDLAYLCRYYLKGILGVAYNRVNFSAYLLLPSACGKVKEPSDRQIGNQNAYAALKEIDYYMTISNRGERFTMDYGTSSARNVDIVENIFDFCTLVEGIGDGGVFHENNSETARQIIADSILNIICADREVHRLDEDKFLVDSFLSNQVTKTFGKIETQSDKKWPRDVNYIYSVIGFSSCVIPIDLLTVYVAKKIFDEVFIKFRKADLATEDRAADFLSACGLEIKTLERSWKTLQKVHLKKDIQDQADAEFKASGPYYMVNLTKEAIKLIDNAPNDYLHKVRKKKNNFGANQEKWNRIEELYHTASAYLYEINNKLYDVYTYAIEVLKKLIESNAGLLTDTNEYKNTFGKSFYWSPIDMTPGDQATTAVTLYLDSILSERDIKKLANKFVERLCEKKDEWTGLDTNAGQSIMCFDVANEIRSFIQDNLQECISTTMEQFLVKAYSGNVDAPVFTYDDHGNQIYSLETADAANTILSRLSQKASALASVSDFNLEDTYSNVYLTLPADCKWLYQAVVDRAAKYGINENCIYKSTAKDRVVLCKLYTGVPAWALLWTKEAENDYEFGKPNKVGLHIDQGENGTNWAELPNLYPEKLWSSSDVKSKTREANISRKVREMMENALELEMLRSNLSEEDYYDLILLEKDEETAQSLLEKAGLNNNKTYTIGQVLDLLLEKEILSKDKLIYANMVMTTPDELSSTELSQFRFDMACRTMRRLKGKWNKLEHSIKVFKELKKLLPQPIAVDTLNNYINALVYDLLRYDGRRGYWISLVNDEERIGNKLNDKLERQCAHYYGFKIFASLDADEMEEFIERIKEVEAYNDEHEDAFDEADDRRIALKKMLKAFRIAKKETDKPWSDNSPYARDGNETEWPMATQKFEERAGESTKVIRKFYDDLIANI